MKAYFVGRDCIGGAKTGSGKTIAFAAPILQNWSKDPYGIFALVLTPTRELALQIADQFLALGASVNLKLTTVLGGTSQLTQAISLSHRPHVVVATPGRLADLIMSSSGDDITGGFKRCKILVLDEADRLLESSFADDLSVCMDVLPKASEGRQTLLFTATITDDIRAIKSRPLKPNQKPPFLTEINAETYHHLLPQSSYAYISLAVPSTLKQRYHLLPHVIKLPTLHLLLQHPSYKDKPTLIFVNKTQTAELLRRTLRLLSHTVTSLHSQLAQHERQNSLGRFRAEAAKILVATDLASRGLDIPVVSLVINFDLPQSPEDYIHRVGRTARAGRSGMSISFVTERDVLLIKAIEERVGTEMPKLEDEEGVSEKKVLEAMKEVGEARRMAVMMMDEEGWENNKKRKRGH
jgi:ATP-dependent RNA helicase DDX49/DBP8